MDRVNDALWQALVNGMKKPLYNRSLESIRVVCRTDAYKKCSNVRYQHVCEVVEYDLYDYLLKRHFCQRRVDPDKFTVDLRTLFNRAVIGQTPPNGIFSRATLSIYQALQSNVTRRQA